MLTNCLHLPLHNGPSFPRRCIRTHCERRCRSGNTDSRSSRTGCRRLYKRNTSMCQ